MAQTPKFIDITRTFIPIDPNAFPEGLTIGGGESSPEERIPAMAYKGYNFMPTSYGYRSYFGLNSTLSVDPTPTGVDELFIYQNALFENILIALTSTGIWIKKGQAAGAWTQSVTYVAPVGETSYIWTHVIIADKLYVYQQGRGSYYVITTHATNGVTITEQTPNFLLMQYQIGIFRAAGRLAFWDTTDAVSWSNLDDFTDFKPSLETLAGNASFTDVQGRIITILSHGEGFMIYATKSIMFVSQDVTNLYQWKPKVLFPSTGIEYPRQACAASPDTLHFAYTNEGLKKIDKAQQETIVPEVTDFLKASTFPIYLKVLEGRFLFLEMMDEAYIVGNVQHGEVIIPSEEYKFDGSQYTLDNVVIPSTPAGICPILDGLDNGDYTDMQPGAPHSSTPAPSPSNGHKSPDPNNPGYAPDWLCYISSQGVKDASNIEWVATPCPTLDLDGKDVLMCPKIPTVDKYTTDTTNKKAVSGADAYQDGKWTMARFQAVQSAIWEAESQAAKAVIAAIEGRAKQHQKNGIANTCIPTTLPLGRDTCNLGRFPSEFSQASFGYNLCSFWMTRYIIGAKDINRIQTNSIACNANTNTDIPGTLSILVPTLIVLGGAAMLQPMDGSKEAIGTAAVAARNAKAYVDYPNWSTIGYTCHFESAFTSGGSSTPFSSMAITVIGSGYTTANIDGHQQYASGTGLVEVQATIVCPTGYWPFMSGGNPMCRMQATTYDKISVMSTFNEGKDVAIAPIPDSGFCVIQGWNYTASDGTRSYMAANSCSTANGATHPPSQNSSPSGSSGYHKAPINNGISTPPPIPIDPLTGNVCGQGANGLTIDGEIISWPGTEVIIPASSFLFYAGSSAPFYPTVAGAFVYDLQLKKWGKMKNQYKLLIDYSPINSSASGVVDPSIFGILGGVLQPDYKISIFDRSPRYSYITYGKVGYYRLGNTSVEEVRVDFRTTSTGSIRVDTSLDGSSLDPNLVVSKEFLGATQATLYGAWPGRWVNITVSGVYDISYLEYRGFTQGRR